MKKILGVLVLLGAAGLCVFVWALSNNKVVIGYNKGYMPDQPLPFSHQLHAGKYQIDCRYCHTSVEVSRHASVPSLNICMNCHLVVKTGSPWIKQLTEAYNSGKSIAWQKVHLLPDYVKFNHAAHIYAFEKRRQAKIANGSEVAQAEPVPADDQSRDPKKFASHCTVCHGPVSEMPKIYQNASLAMGWCVNCHRLPENHAPVTCGTCHY